MEGEEKAKAPKVTVREATPKKPAPDKSGYEVTDSLGRKLKIRKLNALMRYDLAKLVGGNHVANGGVMGPAAMALSVSEIDGEMVFPPATEAELRVIIQRLDDEGLDAVAKAYVEAGWVEADIDTDALKNL